MNSVLCTYKPVANPNPTSHCVNLSIIAVARLLPKKNTLMLSKYTLKVYGGACSMMVIGNGLGDPCSNAGQGRLQFT